MEWGGLSLVHFPPSARISRHVVGKGLCPYEGFDWRIRFCLHGGLRIWNGVGQIYIRTVFTLDVLRFDMDHYSKSN